MNTPRITTWLVDLVGSAEFQSNPDLINEPLSVIRMVGLLIWISFAALCFWRVKNAKAGNAFKALTLIAKIYFCCSIILIALMTVAVTGFLNSSVTDLELKRAEFLLEQWSLEILFCWAVGIAAYGIIDFVSSKMKPARQPSADRF